MEYTILIKNLAFELNKLNAMLNRIRGYNYVIMGDRVNIRIL